MEGADTLSMQKIVMKNPGLMRLFMSRAPSSVHTKGGRRKVDEVLEVASTRTIAYPTVLREHGIDPGRKLTHEDLPELPLLDKKSYIDRFPLEELTIDGVFHGGYTVEKSSGHSGGTHYWFRTPEEDELFPQYLEYAFRQFYHIDQVSTLVIMGLALGTWTSGEKMAQALRQVAATGKYPLTIMSPGNDLEEILEIVEDISPNFFQTVIVGYPPFVKHVLDTGAERGIDWRAFNVKVGLGGEGYSEHWRSAVGDLIGVDTEKDLLAVSGGYGAADIGMTVGREYPLTVLIRRIALQDEALRNELFGHEIPNLFQYSPSGVFIEEVENELVFTVRSGIPLVRYNIHDRGGVLAFDHVMDVLADFGYDVATMLEDRGYTPGDLWRMPFFYCYGRSDGTVMLAGVNVYPESVTSALTVAGMNEIAGHKIGAAVDDTSYSQRLLVHLEHRSSDLGEADAAMLAERYREVIVDGLKQVNKEFRNLHDAAPDMATPLIRVYSMGSGPFASDQGKIKRSYRLADFDEASSEPGGARQETERATASEEP
jgi:phenylacetate-CoA ligase